MVAPTAGAAPATSPVSDVIEGDEPVDYVALGDSFSAGPLIQVQRLDPLGCLRSTNNYPAFLAGYLGVASYVDVTCSGAETEDLRNREQTTIVPGPSPAPQVQALSAETDLVTIGIGGNDFGLFGSMISDCEAVAPSDPKGAPCRRHFTNRKGVDTKLRDAERIEKKVRKVLKAVERRAPDAEVYVVGYPRLLPQKGTCKAVKFAAGDYRWGNKVEKRLNRSLKRAAKARGAAYLDLYPASRGHDACAGSEAWINGSTLKPLRAANFHPFKRGMRGAAQEIYRQMTGGKTAPAGILPRIADNTPLAGKASAEPRVLTSWQRWLRSEAQLRR